MQDNVPYLISRKTLKPEFDNLEKIQITSEDFSIGRGLKNSVVIPFLAISRSHCIIRKINHDGWFIEDYSSFGIEINGVKLGKGGKRRLKHEDEIALDSSKEFVFTFIDPAQRFVHQSNPDNSNESPRKRIKLEKCDEKEINTSNKNQNDIISNVKMKFEQSQSFEIKHIEDKIQNAKQMQSTSMILKQQLQSEMNRKIQQLKNNYTSQIENLKGEKSAVEIQKAMLIEERDKQLATITNEMKGKISELMEKIKRHSQAESELITENKSLKDKLLKERNDFLSELNKESSSKQQLLKNLEAKIQEQEENRLKEKNDLEKKLQIETERLKIAKEQELRELEQQKKTRELELLQELNEVKRNLEAKMEQTEQQKSEVEQVLNNQMEQMKKVNDEEKAKIEKLTTEREELQKKLTEAQTNANKSIIELETRVQDRETELAALAAERIQKHSEQTTEVINSLLEQLERVKNQLKTVESEKEILKAETGESSKKENIIAEFTDIMETELQCSICSELFVAATTLSCSHTFCKYCITKWKKKKKECPICRASITSECKSLVLDSFIEKIVENLSEEMKQKRMNLLKSREELEAALPSRNNIHVTSGGNSSSNDENFFDDHEDEEEEEFEGYLTSDYWPLRRRRELSWSDSDSGPDFDSVDSLSVASSSASDRSNSDSPFDTNSTSDATSVDIDLTNDAAGSEDAGGIVPGIPGSYYGGYGRCYKCGAPGHWAPGCPVP